MVEIILFWLFSILGIAGAVGLIFNRNPIYAALSLIINFFSIAGLYLSLRAEFLAVIQILVYAGAIMVLFLFVIMLLNLQTEEKAEKFDAKRGIAFLFGLAFAAEMIYALRSFASEGQTPLAAQFDYGQVEPIGRSLMTSFLFPFEMISVVLLAALIGAIVVARKHTYT
ncbi:MAG: NADH-quinone oxidoreductase subunit J [Bacteroidetes bacterium]|nr:MAG: NADH-quinone oxidoreductase subunit J [Bacteroidota bacterium]